MHCGNVSPSDFSELEDEDIFVAMPICPGIALRSNMLHQQQLIKGVYYYIPTNFGLAIVTKQNDTIKAPRFAYLGDFAYILRCVFALREIIPTEEHVRRPNLPRYLLLGIFLMCRSVHATYMLLSELGHVTVRVDQVPSDQNGIDDVDSTSYKEVFHSVNVTLELDISRKSDPKEINMVYCPTKELYVYHECELFGTHGKGVNSFVTVPYTSIPLQYEGNLFYVYPIGSLDKDLGVSQRIIDTLERISHPHLGADVIENPNDHHVSILVTARPEHFQHGTAHSRVLDDGTGGALGGRNAVVPMPKKGLGETHMRLSAR